MPPWHADAIGAGWRSQTIGEIFKGTDGACADPDTRIFPATGSTIRQSPSSASLCSAPSPVWEKAFIVMRYARNLAVLLNYRSQRSLILTPNKCPRGTPILIGVGWRSQAKGEIFKGTDGACADPGTQNFPCRGGVLSSCGTSAQRLVIVERCTHQKASP